jgi:hypothetical protein
MNHEAETLIKKNSSGAIIQTHNLDLGTAQIDEVLSLQFDGYYYWSLEKPVSTGFRLRKWEIGTDTLVRVVTEQFFASDSINKYDVNALAVEHYSDSLDNQETPGTVVFDVNDGSVIRPGDDIIIGPSTATGFVGEYHFTSVIGKVGTQITVDVPIGITFNANDPIVFTRDLFAFSDTGPGNTLGALYKFRASDWFPLSVDVSGLYTEVRAATFFQSKVMFVRGNEVVWLNPDSLDIFKSQAITNSTEDRAGVIETFDLDGYANDIYRLEQKRVYLDGGDWATEEWAPFYNYNTSGIVPEVFFVALKAQPQILHRAGGTPPVPAEDLDSVITVTVLDQFRTPVFNRVVDFTSTHGPLSSLQETTNADGQAFTKYTANTAEAEVTITATVT